MTELALIDWAIALNERFPTQSREEHKKAPGDLTSRGPCPSFDDPLPFIEVTREREWENRRNRSWTPAMVGSTRGKKRRQGMPPINKGTNASKVLASQPNHPLQSVGGAVGIVYELPKKRGVFPKHPLVRRIAPSPKKQSNDDVRFSDWSSPSRQNKGCGQQPKKKTGFPRRYG